jgi:murein DD-endopeptidase MepM/ murein hydrolase activator NlpD
VPRSWPQPAERCSETHDGRPEQIPGSVAKDVAYTLDVSLGNNIVVDIGGGRFAFYAHLQPGSLRVKPGDKVVTGQVLAQVGNSGNTDAPHLHFHIVDGPVPLKANGLPYAFTRFTGRGVVTGEDLPLLMLHLSKGEVAPIDKSAFAGPHVDQLPLNLQVIDFD